MNDERFEQLLQGMRDEDVGPEELAAARERVWNRLQADGTVACDELRPELRAYAAGRASESRRLLIDDHLSRCVECRRALQQIKRAGKVVAMPARPARRSHWKRWAAAAAIVVAVLYAGRGAIDSALAPAGPRATVVAVSGTLYQPSGALLPVGAELYEGQAVRTAAGSHAVLELRDGSRVELNQRTELAVQSARSGDTIRLSWGDIIIEAADQDSRSLRVVTRDSIASVKGTVFAVSSGTAGSLVSVVEGSVEVSQAGRQNLLRAGQQAASNPSLGEVSVTQAVSWSEEADGYYALLAELAQIEEQLALSGPSMRREARLLPYMPADVFAYFAIPNLDGTIADAIRLVDQRAATSSALGDWWYSDDGRDLREVLEHMQGVGELLGDELVVMLSGSGEPMPLFLAEVRSGSSEQLLRTIQEAAGDGEMPPVQVTENLLLAADSHADLALLSAQLGLGAGSPFAAEIEQHYGRGVGWLGALDVAAFNRAAAIDNEFSRLVGLSSMSYLFVEQRSGAAGDESEATLSFRGAREGMASWLHEPGAIGAAEYISSGAIAASASSTRDPREAFDQILALAGSDSEFMSGIRELESEIGISVRDDIAASLGTDFVLALEAMSVTEPQWILAFEVLNAGAIDDAVRRMVQNVNADIAARLGDTSDDDRLTFGEEIVNGRTWKMLYQGTDSTDGFTWTYDRGYLVGSTDRGAVMRAIAVRDAGSSLVRSADFQQQLPSGTGVHSSGFVWVDIGRFAGAIEALGQDTFGIEGDTQPLLVVVTGEDNRIHWASRTRLTRLIFDLMMSTSAIEAL